MTGSMTQIGSITPSLTPTGLATPIKFQQFVEQFNEKRRLKATQNRKRITAKYGELSDEDILSIIDAEKILAECEKCLGVECDRASHIRQQPTITVCGGQAQIEWHECETAQAYRKQQRLVRRLKNAKIPERYCGKTLADYQVDEFNKVAVQFAKNALKTRKGAFFFGERGTGKTFLAAIIAQEYLQADKTVIFIKVPRLLDEFYSVIRGQSTLNEQELLQEMYTADLVVLDDFGMEKATKYAGTTLCKILDARYDNPNLTTIITSNYPLEQIQSELDNATDGKSYNGSRLYDRCREICKPILFKGHSRRR